MIDYGYGALLGPLSEIDPLVMHEWRNSPLIYKWCRQHSPLELWEHEAWLKSLDSRLDVRMFGIFKPKQASTPRLELVGRVGIGVCGLTSLDYINGHAEFSLYIEPSSQNKGYGKSALQTLIEYGFDVLRLNHIFGETFEGNPAARMFEAVGFKKEGTRRKYYFREGQFIDCHLYSILASEF